VNASETRCDQCGMPPGECVDDYGKRIGDCYAHDPETCGTCRDLRGEAKS
jgi:hypothetical protein